LNIKALESSLVEEKDGSGFITNSTIETNAVRKVLRENWASKLKEKESCIEVLERHAEFMNREFGSLDYEASCLQNIALHARHMSKGELLAYTKFVEALAVGYKSKFGLDFSGLLIAGVTLVSIDMRTLKKHFDYFVTHLYQNSDVYAKRLDRELTRIEKLNSEICRKDSGILKFLRKKEVASLRSRVKSKQAKIGRLQGKRTRYNMLADNLKARTTLPLLKKK